MQSAWKEQTRGCTLGSSFEPLLWNLIQNHLPLYAESENLFMYRNDHQIYMTADSIKKDVQERMSETEMVTQWYKVTLCLTL